MIDFFIESVRSYNLSTWDWIFFSVAVFLIGLSKAGLKGVSILAVPLFANIFGAKASVGVMLPILIMADIMTVSYYMRHTNWNYLFKILPWAALGILIATFTGDYMNESQFRKAMAWIIILCVILLFWWEYRKSDYVPNLGWFAAVIGISAGFTSMIGNLAGPLITIYLLAMRLPKDSFIGTGAWFFFFINIFKVPFHVFVWDTISLKSFMIDLAILPVLILSFFVGVLIVGKINNKLYKQLILVMTAIAGIMLLFR